MKRRLVTKSLEVKYKAIVAVEQGRKKTDVARDFEVPLSTLSTWLKNGEDIKSAFASSSSVPQAKRMRVSTYSDVEKALELWIREARDASIPISGPIVLVRAKDLAKQLGHEDFDPGKNWAGSFLHRHGLVFRSIVGEEKAAPKESVESWKNSVLPGLLEEYSPDDIYNADETALFWRLEPSKSFVYKGDSCHGGKRSKDRITILPCANMSGNSKLPLLTIGKFAKPRCFNGVPKHRIPTEYTHQRRAWMDSILFSSWLAKIDNKMTREGRRIALVVDNCRAHKKTPNLKSIKLIYLPPNTTASCQPMDQGIIQNLKVLYRRLYVTRALLPASDKKCEVQWSLLDALIAVRDAWESVKPSTISNCFRHCGFEAAGTSYAETADSEYEHLIAEIATDLSMSRGPGFR